MKKIFIFIGGIWLDEQEKEIIEKSKQGVQIAANTLQKNIIDGIEEVAGTEVTIINEIFVGAFPRLYTDIEIKAGIFNHTKKEAHKDYNVEFLNLPLIKHYFRYHNSKKYIKKILSDNLDSEIYVIGYSMSESIVKGLIYAKKIKPNIKTCLIVPDLPEYMSLGKKRDIIYDFIKKLNMKSLYTNIKKLDSFVILTKQMYSRLKVDKPYVVVEGIAPSLIEEAANVLKVDNKFRNIVYTGTLDEKYGIKSLVDSFCKLTNKDIRLIICGNGDSKEYIKEKAREDKRIIFLGLVDNKTAKKLQREAYILVNPRSEKEEYTKYSFPSKTMEYMVAGRPVVMNRLEGIPKEYDDYLFYIEKDMYNTLKKVLELPSCVVNKRGKSAQDFVIKNKNKVSQAKRIVELLYNL